MSKKGKDLIKKEIPEKLVLKMQEKLEGIEDFSHRLSIVVDTIENMFRLFNGERLLEFDSYKRKRRFRKYKKKKKWKKRYKQQL